MTRSSVTDKAELVVNTEWVLFTIGLIGLCTFLTVFGSRILLDLKEESSNSGTWKIVIAFVIVSILLGLVINTLITIGVYKRRLKLCLIWHIINIISIGFSGLGLGISVIYLFMDAANIITVTITCLSFTYRYMCGIYLGRFIEELKSEERLDATGAARVIQQSQNISGAPYVVGFSQNPNPYSNMNKGNSFP